MDAGRDHADKSDGGVPRRAGVAVRKVAENALTPGKSRRFVAVTLREAAREWWAVEQWWYSRKLGLW